MVWLLQDLETKKYFSLPHGPERSEWSSNPWIAHQFHTLERVRGGQTVWFHIHKKWLDIVEFTDACKKHEEFRAQQELGGGD